MGGIFYKFVLSKKWNNLRFRNVKHYYNNVRRIFMSWLTDLFNPKKNKAQDLPEVKKFTRPQDTEAGGYVLPILKSRASGQGVAFSPEQLTEFNTPYATAARGQFERYGKPAIEESFAARGLSKSPMAGQAEAVAEKDLADLIGVNWSELNKWNEVLKQSGITSGISGLQDFTGRELSQSNATTEAENARNMENYAIAEKNRTMIPDMISTGLTTAGNIASTIGDYASGNAILDLLRNRAGSATGNQIELAPSRSISSVGNDGFASGGSIIAELLRKKNLAYA
jgi:hypothetical protein